jgi:hypothetical protein
MKRADKTNNKKVKVEKGATIEDVLKLEYDITHPRLLATWVKNIVTPAQPALPLIKDKLKLTRRLMILYNKMVEERKGSKITTDQKLRFGGPLQILERYIQWIPTQGWEDAGYGPLDIESPAFNRFRSQDRRDWGNDQYDTITEVDPVCVTAGAAS